MAQRGFEHRMVLGLILLLIFEASILALHFAWGGFQPRPAEQHAQIAGEVSRSENEILRRGANSLVWEKSGTNQPLYFYDSVLTLSQSTASLRLYKDTEVQLSENTLVTIEPQDKTVSGEIRLKFHRGGFKARNPFFPTQVEGEAWSLDIKSGSEVDLRQVDDGKFELNVSKGEVDFNSASGNQTVSSQEVLRIDSQSSSKLQKLAAHWVEPPPKRVYIFGGITSANLKWTGDGATQLLIHKVQAAESAIELAPGSQQTTVAISEGQYRFFLRNGDRTSDPLDIEVWPAPIIHLIFPLPRNRIQTNTQTQFIWTHPPGVHAFELKVKGDKTKWERDRKDNAYTTQFETEDDLEWSVWGVDAQGFSVPSLYSSPLFIREDPLQAPKLKPPTLRQPATEKGADDRGARFWFRLQQWILPQAHAEQIPAVTPYEALFSWEPVDRADHYVIEISETSDFRTPLIVQKVIKSEFLWKKAPLKPIYWRVAAGTSQRLGYFSEAQMSDLASENSGVEVRPSAPVAPPKPAAKPAAPLMATAPASTSLPAPPPAKEFEEKFRLEWRPTGMNIQIEEGRNVKADLQGYTMLSIAGRSVHRLQSERIVHIHFDLSHTEFQSEPKKKFPFQENITWSDYRVHSVFLKSTSHHGWGLLARKTTGLKRSGLERLNAVDVFLLGASFNSLWHWGRWQYSGNAQLLGGEQFGGATAHLLRRPLGRWIFGLGLEGEYRLKSGGGTMSVTAQTSIGFEF